MAQITLAQVNPSKKPIFDRKSFKEVFDAEAQKRTRAQGKKNGGKSDLIKCIAEALYPNFDPDDSFEMIKKWCYGKNGPRNPEDIEKLEEFFGHSFSIPHPTISKGDLSFMNNCEVTVAERSAARELYQLMTDLIRAHQKAMYCFWYADFPVHNNTKWAQYVPNDYPVLPDIQYQIRKISFDLPQEVRDDTLRLAEELYSYPSFPEEKDEGVPYPLMDYEYDNFIIFLRKKSKDELKWKNSGEVMDEWFEFSNEQTKNFYNTLDEIFYAYRR